MSHEQTHQQPFARAYPMPENPMAAELELSNSFAREFPEAEPLLREVLGDLQRYTGGETTPKYQIVPEDRERAHANGLADESGAVQPSKSFRSDVALTMPRQYKKSELDAMTESERVIAVGTQDGSSVIGEMPPETRALLEGIYQLTGAEVIRDDHDTGEVSGVVLRQGTYNGKPVHINEFYDDNNTGYFGKRTLKVFLLDDQDATSLKNQLTQPQIEEFLSVSGLPRTDILHTLETYGVTRNNYHNVAGVLKQTRELVDGVEEGVRAPKQSRPKSLTRRLGGAAIRKVRRSRS